MFTFIHAADLHLDSPLVKLDGYDGAPVEDIRGATRRALDNLVRLAIDEKVAFVAIAGDLYDGSWRDYNTGLHLISHMRRLREAHIPVYVVTGNHDAQAKMTRSLRYPDNVHVLPAAEPASLRVPGMDVVIHGQSFPDATVRTNLAQAYPPAVAGSFNLGLLHTSLTGREGHADYAPCSLEDLRPKGYDYWALGHAHRYEIVSESPWVVFSGNTQGRHIRETGPKGCALVRVDDAGRPSPELRPLDVVRWERLAVDATDAASGVEVVDRFRDALGGPLERSADRLQVLRVRVDGSCAAHDELLADPERWRSEIRAVAVADGGDRVWIEKVLLRTRPTEAPARARRADATGAGSHGTALGEMLALVEELAADPDALDELAKELSSLDGKLPGDYKQAAEGWRPHEREWIAERVAEARPLLLERLLRGRGAS